MLAEKPELPSNPATLSFAVPSGFGQMPIAPCQPSELGSPYVPVDSWMYPAMDRLHALGQVDTAYLGMRPWTRLSIVHMLEAASPKMEETTEDSTRPS